jgi:hypothetical protein
MIDIPSAFYIGAASFAAGVGFAHLLMWRFAGAKEEYVEAEPIILRGFRCVGEHQRHLFEGQQWCERGCGALNPRWRGGDAAAVPTEAPNLLHIAVTPTSTAIPAVYNILPYVVPDESAR